MSFFQNNLLRHKIDIKHFVALLIQTIYVQMSKLLGRCVLCTMHEMFGSMQNTSLLAVEAQPVNSELVQTSSTFTYGAMEYTCEFKNNVNCNQ